VSTEVLKARSRLATKSRSAVSASPDEIEDARRDLAVAKIADYVERVVSGAPPLTDLQRDRIAALLRAGGSVC
jgi:hypothetical protein